MEDVDIIIAQNRFNGVTGDLQTQLDAKSTQSITKFRIIDLNGTTISLDNNTRLNGDNFWWNYRY